MAKFKFNNGELKDNFTQLVGSIVGNDIRNAKYQITAIICGNDIRDFNGHVLARIDGNYIRDANSKIISNISDIKKEFDGVENLDPKYIAALWLSFVKN